MNENEKKVFKMNHFDLFHLELAHKILEKKQDSYPPKYDILISSAYQSQ